MTTEQIKVLTPFQIPTFNPIVLSKFSHQKKEAFTSKTRTIEDQQIINLKRSYKTDNSVSRLYLEYFK